MLIQAWPIDQAAAVSTWCQHCLLTLSLSQHRSPSPSAMECTACQHSQGAGHLGIIILRHGYHDRVWKSIIFSSVFRPTLILLALSCWRTISRVNFVNLFVNKLKLYFFELLNRLHLLHDRRSALRGKIYYKSTNKSKRTHFQQNIVIGYYNSRTVDGKSVL